MRKLLASGILLLLCGFAHAQLQQDIILDQPLTGNTDVVAQKTIVLKPGFHAPSGITFTASLDVFAVTQNHFNHNFVKKETMLVAGISTESQIDGLTEDSKSAIFNYVDGLGRPMQTVAIKASPTKNDMVQHIEYDEFGRQVKKYLPYSVSSQDGALRSEPLAEQLHYFNTQTGIANSAYPYAEKVFDNSQLNRVMQQGAPGADWQPHNTNISNSGHTVKYNYLSNTLADGVIIWSVDNTGNCINEGTYAANQLYVNETTDENGTVSKEYTDKLGQVVLKVADPTGLDLKTYYVYDDFGRLRYVFPPKAVDQIGVTTPIAPTDFSELIYYYEYDGKGRMVKKKLPGTDEILMVYDRRDRLVLTQDGNLRTEGKWSFTKYDLYNRPIMTGVAQLTNVLYSDLVTAFEGHTDYTEYIHGTETYGYTLNNSYPAIAAITDADVLSATYYDNYDVVNLFGLGAIFTFSWPSEFGTIEYCNEPMGLVTGTLAFNLDKSDFYVTVNYYDKYYRVIQSTSENHLNGYDRVSTQYDFTGKVLATKHEQTVYFGAESNTVEYTYNTYDHAGRLIKTEHQIGDNAANKVTLAQLEYNENGELIEKNIGKSATASKYQQSVDYKYNIRGWLSGINDPDSPQTIDAGDEHAFPDLFDMKFYYNNPLTDLGQTVSNANYNGNIAGVKWAHQGDDIQGYAYQYDKINRILSANYGNSNGGWSDPEFDVTGRNTEPGITYDKNGNITSLGRKDETETGTGGWLDNMHYRYNGNKLMALGLDGVDASATDDYHYDQNGNMDIDNIKGLAIDYNVLNLPEKVDYGSGNYINYIYDATGQKLAQDVYVANNLTRTTDYVGNIVYKDNSFQYLLTAEGRVNKPGTDFVYEYHLKDHLGNTRVAFLTNAAGPVAEQKSDYYPFGLRFAGSLNNDNKYLYNGKELQEGIDSDNNGSIDLPLGWYDYGARFYDAVLGRWHTLDPLMEKYPDYSPYAYCFNNPIRFFDPNGMEGFDPIVNDPTLPSSPFYSTYGQFGNIYFTDGSYNNYGLPNFYNYDYHGFNYVQKTGTSYGLEGQHISITYDIVDVYDRIAPLSPMEIKFSETAKDATYVSSDYSHYSNNANSRFNFDRAIAIAGDVNMLIDSYRSTNFRYDYSSFNYTKWAGRAFTFYDIGKNIVDKNWPGAVMSTTLSASSGLGLIVSVGGMVVNSDYVQGGINNYAYNEIHRLMRLSYIEEQRKNPNRKLLRRYDKEIRRLDNLQWDTYTKVKHRK